MKDLHKVLKKEREQKGYSQEYVAERLKVSSSTISRWETRQSPMNTRQIYAYAAILEISEYGLFARVATRFQEIPKPILAARLELFDQEAYTRIMNLVNELGANKVVVQIQRLI